MKDIIYCQLDLFHVWTRKGYGM